MFFQAETINVAVQFKKKKKDVGEGKENDHKMRSAGQTEVEAGISTPRQTSAYIEQAALPTWCCQGTKE